MTRPYAERGNPKTFIDRVIAENGITDECITWPFGTLANGYACLSSLKRLYGSGTEIVSRYICRQVHGNPPTPDHEAAHSCCRGNLGCINPKHLRWATHLENVGDTVALMRHNHGDKHNAAKLSSKEIPRMRIMFRVGLSNIEIGHLYGVHRRTISDVRLGKTWAHA